MKKVRRKLRPTEIGVIKTFSLSPDDEVGEIAVQCSGCTYYYNNLRELCEGWEDYEEPKEYWYIDPMVCGVYCTKIEKDEDLYDFNKQIGNYFSSREEAEKAVEKLKAFKRLKDKGFRFRWIDMQTGQIKYSFFLEKGQKFTRGDEDDLLLLFGGEE